MSGSQLSFFERDGERYVPTGLGVSPWNGHSQNGVSLAGLAAHVAAQIPSPVEMLPTRLSLDILGAVPMTPLTARTNVLREGKRIQILDVALEAEGVVKLRATLTRIRTAAAPSHETPLTKPFPADAERRQGQSWFHVIQLDDGRREGAPGAWWINLDVDVVAGSPVTPWERLAMASDFGNGVAPPLPFKDWNLANVDIALHLTRLPRSEWLLVDAFSETAGNGFGMSTTRIGDLEGMIGGAHQSLFIERRG
jgi:hypothetical protein